MRRLQRVGWRVALPLAGIPLVGIAPAAALTQMPAMVPADPDAPRKEGFDTDRAIFWEERNFDPLRNPEWESLAEARRDGRVSDETPVLTFEAGGQALVLVTSQMSYHHVAQGEMAGEPWMVTF